MLGGLIEKGVGASGQLFGKEWPKVLHLVVLLLVSSWVWLGVLPSLQSSPVGFFSWTEQVAIEVFGNLGPSWVHALVAWRPAHHGQVAAVLMAIAVLLATLSHRNFGQNFALLSLLAILLGIEWGGFAVAIFAYGAFCATLVAVGILAALYHKLPGTGERYIFDGMSIGLRMVEGPIAPILLPILLPIIIGAHVFLALGIDREDPRESPATTTVRNAWNLLEERRIANSSLNLTNPADVQLLTLLVGGLCLSRQDRKALNETTSLLWYEAEALRDRANSAARRFGSDRYIV